MFIELKDLYIKKELVCGISKATILASYNTPELYTLSLFILNFKEPVSVVFSDEEERDVEYDRVKGLLS